MHTIQEMAAISRAFALSAEELFTAAATTLVCARVVMVASGILLKAAQDMRALADGAFPAPS